MRIIRLFWLAALAVSAAPPAAACSVERGYRVPSNLELAGQAETIVVARVVDGELDAQNPEASTVTIRPLAAVKGPLPDGDIALRGMMLSRDVGQELGMISNPYDFQRAHPVSYIGACIRYIFPLGTTALFFLRVDHEGMWAPAAPPVSRWAEDVPDGQAPWVQLTRAYAIAAALPEADRGEYLADEREALLARADDPVAQLMAADIARQIDGTAGKVDLGLFEEDAGKTGNAVDAALEAMRRAGSEAGD
jgi:hypothetical protein